MSQGLIRRTLSRGVGKRVLGYFLVAAIVPMFFTAWLASYEFNRGLEVETARALKDSAKEYGVEILTRLQDTTAKGREIIRIASKDGLASIYEHEYLVDDFEAVWVIREDDERVLPCKPMARESKYLPPDEQHLNAGGTQTADYAHTQIGHAASSRRLGTRLSRCLPAECRQDLGRPGEPAIQHGVLCLR